MRLSCGFSVASTRNPVRPSTLPPRQAGVCGLSRRCSSLQPEPWRSGRALVSLARARVLLARRQHLRAYPNLVGRGEKIGTAPEVPSFLLELVLVKIRGVRCERHGSSPRLAPRGSLHGRFGVGPGHNMRADRVRAQGGAPRGRGSMLRSAEVQGVGGRAGLASPWRDTRLSGLQSRLPGWIPRQLHI